MYCTIDDLRSRIEEPTLTALADDDGDGAPDAQPLAAAIEDADAEIDTILAARYGVPIVRPPAILRALGAWLAIAALFRRRRETPSPLHAAQAEHARRTLALMAEGRVALPGVPTLVRPASTRAPREKIFRPGTIGNL